MWPVTAHALLNALADTFVGMLAVVGALALGRVLGEALAALLDDIM